MAIIGYSVVDDIKLVKINVMKMPRKQSAFVKYRCREPFCAKLIRQDKWPVWYENLSGVVIRPDKSRHKNRWPG